MGYAVGAAELIPTLKQSQGNTYTVAIIPQGPHFYTGLLQAGGYLLLDHKKKDMLVISEQTENPEDIVIDPVDYSPILGKSWKNPVVTIKELSNEIGAKKKNTEHPSISETIHQQLPFIRVMTQTKGLVHISVGKKIGKAALEKIVQRIDDHRESYNIVFLTNIELSPIPKSGKSDEQKKIHQIIRTASPNKPLLYIFRQVLDILDKEPEIIAYVNPKDFGRSSSIATRYICAVG